MVKQDGEVTRTPPGTPERPTSRRAKHHAAAFTKELAFVAVGALLVSTLLRAFVGQMFIIPSGSMENTLLKQDRVVVEKLTSARRGQTVVFEDPGNWLSGSAVTAPNPTILERALELVGVPTQATPGHLIKRVIGMPGDTVTCCDPSGRLTVNGAVLDETGYLYQDSGGTRVAASEIAFTVVVPRDHLFVMGDHRDMSADSRCHLSDEYPGQRTGQVAFVPLDLVVGPAVAIAAPFDRAHRLRVPETFQGVPGPTTPAPELGVIKPAGVRCPG